MHWYVSYRTVDSTVIHVFKKKELAIAAPWGFLDYRFRDALEIGPMLRDPEGRRLHEQDLQRIRHRRAGSAAPT
jgi:hypothetical protein